MKKLSDMSLKELWELFPIVVEEHNPLYKKWYEDEMEHITEVIGPESISRINHIGSTAVEGLIAKPTVDILMEITDLCNIENIISSLKEAGWVLISFERVPELKVLLGKGYTLKGFDEKVFHLHIRYSGDWNELYFRDFLREHKDIADEYGELKLSLQKIYKNDRDGYTDMKSDFVLENTLKAKEEFKDRYRP